MSEPKTVTITEGEYTSLLSDAFKLQCLEHWGVDNWEGYGDALVEGGWFDREDAE